MNRYLSLAASLAVALTFLSACADRDAETRRAAARKFDQALTQVQEATLIYAPKILMVFVTLLITLPLMGALMSGFMHHIADRIASM